MKQNSETAPVATPMLPPAASKSEAPPSNSTVARVDSMQLRDIHAQEAMAFWAFWMFVAALATIVVTGIGTWLISRQITLRHILMPLLAQPIGQSLVRSMGNTMAGLVARSTEDTREHVATSLRDWRRAADDPKEFENLSQILGLAR